jgi:type II secretory pathway predicted ATPase ExeA
MPTTPPAVRSLRQLVERGERTFPSHPQVDRYFPATAIEDARRRLSRAIDRGDGPGLVIGGAGMGKTLLLQALAAQFHQRFDVVLLGCARICTRRALLQAILFELGLPYRLRDEGSLRFTLLDHLLSAKQAPTELLLLVDEAQSLPVTLLDELRVMTNLVHGGVPRVRLVMAGSSLLEETFASPELESLSQRLAARCYLTPFSCEETAQFVRAQLSASGAAVDDVLRPEMWEAVFEATDGVPRLVNQLCDRAISVALEKNCTRIDRRVVQDAWSDLQQLPSPWETPDETSTNSSNVVEFGGLELDERQEKPEDFEVDFENELAPSGQTAHDIATQQTPPPPAKNPAAVLPKRRATPENPFDESFDEEEVVLDNFASFGEMFDVGTPRVENRRDAEFASLVRAAIDASGEEESSWEPPRGYPAGSGEKEDIEKSLEQVSDSPSEMHASAQPAIEASADYATTESQLTESDDPHDESDLHWPPIRLAFSQAADDQGADDIDEATSDWQADKDAEPAHASDDPLDLAWPAHVDAYPGRRYDDAIDGETPMIIVEEDLDVESSVASFEPARPQVRRQEYRRLFSRLRSG